MTVLVSILILVGSFFGLIAALGVTRLPDFYCRMHAATKAGAFGATITLLAAALQFGSWRVIVISILLVIFFYLTAPVAAYSLGRAAYRRGVKRWGGTEIDQLAESPDKPETRDALGS